MVPSLVDSIWDTGVVDSAIALKFATTQLALDFLLKITVL